MAFPDLPKRRGPNAKNLVAFRALALLGLLILFVLGWSGFRDRQTRSAFSETIFPMYGDYFAMSFRLRSSSCRNLGRAADEAYGDIGRTFPFASKVARVNILNMHSIASKIGRYNTVNSCLPLTETPNLHTISLFGFTKEAGLVSKLKEQISKEPTLKHLTVRVLDQLPNIASGGGETVVLLLSHQDLGTLIDVDTDQKQRLEINALLHHRLSRNDNLTIERVSSAKQSGEVEDNFVKYGFSLWFGSKPEVRRNFCQVEKAGPFTTEAALISSILACLRLSAKPQTRLSVASGTIP